MMGQNSVLRSPMKEEHLVPESQFFDTDIIIDGFEGIMGNIIKHEEEEEEEEEEKLNNSSNGEALQGDYYMGYNWDLMEWEEFEDKESVLRKNNAIFTCKNEEQDDDAKKVMSLNLSLNYQQVLDAWSNRASTLPNDTSNNSVYMGEVPSMEEDKTRREASVLRYKEKRQNRLFSKKIRYEIRKLNADKRPRIKGRFVKRESREDTDKSARA